MNSHFTLKESVRNILIPGRR